MDDWEVQQGNPVSSTGINQGLIFPQEFLHIIQITKHCSSANIISGAMLTEIINDFNLTGLGGCFDNSLESQARI
jgi:hypothetical protein